MTLRSKLTVATLLMLGSLAAAPAQAIPFQVFALANSSSGGVGLDTINLAAGESFTVSVDPNDLWNAGALPRWSNANGLTGPRFATGTDDSGQLAGTQIGADFGLHSQGGLSAPFGTLVGQIGAGNFFVIGTSFAGIAPLSGILRLFYWDSNSGDNTEFVTADVNAAATPIPGALPLFAAGLGFLGLLAHRRQRKHTA